MGIFELFEIGFFTAFWNWSSPLLTVFVYSLVFIGAVLQIVFRKAFRTLIMKLSLVIFCGFGIVISECLWQAITGWDRLSIAFLYGAVLCLLLGAIISVPVYALMTKKK